MRVDNYSSIEIHIFKENKNTSILFLKEKSKELKKNKNTGRIFIHWYP